MLIPYETPQLFIENSNWLNMKLDSTFLLRLKLSNLENFSKPIIVRKKYNDPEFGIVDSLYQSNLILKTYSNQKTWVDYKRIKEIVDLKSTSANAQLKRIKSGISLAGAAVSIYLLRTSDPPAYTSGNDDIENAYDLVSTLELITVLTFVAGSIYSFAILSDEEEEYEKWATSESIEDNNENKKNDKKNQIFDDDTLGYRIERLYNNKSYLKITHYLGTQNYQLLGAEGKKSFIFGVKLNF